MKMMWLLPLSIFGFVIALARNAQARSGQNPMKVNLNDNSISRWEPFVKVASAMAGIPAEFVMAYIGVESGGNPCAIGVPGAKGPDGMPQELGLFQLYNPDDLKVIKATGKELRAYCASDGSSKQIRQLTSKEIGRHVGLGIANIQRHKARADAALKKYGYNWDEHSKDYWRMVKLVHALPVLVDLGNTPGLKVVADKLGYAPSTWKQYRDTYASINPRARFDSKKTKQDGYYRAFENAEWTGGQVIEDETPTGDA